MQIREVARTAVTATQVLCPVDARSRSSRALASAADCAQMLDVPLSVLSTVEDPYDVGPRQAQVDFSIEDVIGDRQIAEAAVADLMVVSAADPAKRIVAAAGNDGLVVMATTTRQYVFSGHFGSVTEKVIRSLGRPVVAVGPSATSSVREVTGVVVPCNGSALSEAALPVAQAWAKQLQVALTVVAVLDPHPNGNPCGEANYVRRLAQPLDAHWEVLHDPSPAEAISRCAKSQLVVMSTHGRSGFNRLRFGSVAVKTAAIHDAPVVIVCPTNPPAAHFAT